MKKILAFSAMLIMLTLFAEAQYNANSIIGRWRSTEKNVEVEVYQTGNEYRAKIIWFDDSDDKNRPMNLRYDRKNPDKALRSRKIIGLEVLHGLVYNREEQVWHHGRIYDPTTGKDWNASIWLTSGGDVKVRGFWHFEFLGQNIFFKKV